MSRRGNPYDNAKAESFMKTLKVEAVYLVRASLLLIVSNRRKSRRNGYGTVRAVAM
jgi:transposase InsO family protein